MKSILFISILLIFTCISCGNTKENKKVNEELSASLCSVNIDASTKEVIVPKQDTILLPVVYDEGVSILLPAMYRGEKPSDYQFLHSERWNTFLQDTIINNYYLKYLPISVEWGYDDCLQDSVTVINPSAGNDLLLIKGLEETDEPVKSIPVKKKYIWPDEISVLKYNDITYTLKGSGVSLTSSPYSDEDGEDLRWDEVLNYKLFLSVDGGKTEQLIIAIPSFNGTFVQLIWVGDIDRDGKLDFLFDISRDYEERAVILFLSSKAKNGEIIRCVGESSYQFDC